MKNYQLVLASTLPYRQALLNKLALPYITAAPECDETPLPGEMPDALVMRLAQAKATSCQVQSPSLIIGSDQVCVVEGKIAGKPHTREKAIEQLMAQSGKIISFYTGLALHNNDSGHTDTILDLFHVHFRQFDRAVAERYVDKERPFNCAGSFKSEGLGIALFERLEGDDPNTLIGLPLIKLVTLLEKQGVKVL